MSVSAPKNLTDNSVNNGLYTSRSLTRRLLEVPAVRACKALIGKILVFWIGGRLWEVVAYERRSHMEMRLWIKYFPLYEYYTGEKDGTKISL